VRLILQALQSDDPVLKSGAARALAELKTESDEAVAALVEVLDESDPYVIGNAIDALASLGPRSVDDLEETLQNPGLRKYAVRIIYRLGPEAAEAVPMLVKALGTTTDSPEDRTFRQEVHYALAAIGTQASAAVDELIKSLGDEDLRMKGSAAYALGKVGPAAEPAVAKLVEIVKQGEKEGDLRLQRVGVWALLKIRPGNEKLEEFAVPLLVSALSSEEELARIEAALTLGELGEIAKPAVEDLQRLLEDESQAVRGAAQQALQALKD
jgi:HEAT repeat protein